ncbi:complement C1q tumor necrosis factor-related protein 3-like [Ruditapes philippinarum]|uniref:complement C1q tumor necrosis factor-related protein 3-like n=1 Tax=Ruditapes philippinarum TaxID=129788 RepID=UPI00295BB8CB|nr:complement C1q tumor necrosis factor-related protein 3-like [Ruditapes philippinarum]
MFHRILMLAFFSYSQCFLEDQLSTQQRFTALEARVKQLEAYTARCPCVDAVGFNVQLIHDISPMGQYQHIIFDNILANIGNGYDKYSGHFTAPYHGLYTFAVSFTKMRDRNLSVQVVKNGATIAQGLTLTKDVYDTATVTATVELNKGDRVWVENGYPVGGVEDIHGYWTFFSGHLVMSMPN